jgi:hypothetical protein
MPRSERLRKLVEEMTADVPGTRIVEQIDGSILIVCDYIGRGGIEAENFPPWAALESAALTVHLRDTGQEKN